MGFKQADGMGPARFSPFGVWLSVAITSGALNFTVGLLERPQGLVSVPWLLWTFWLSTAATAAICAFGAAIVARRRGSAEGCAFGASVAAVVAFAFVPIWIGGGAIEAACVSVAALASGIAAARASNLLALRRGRFEAGAGLVHAAPWIALATGFTAWAHLYAIGPWRSPLGLAATGGWALSCVIFGAGFARVRRGSLVPTVSAAALVAALGLGAREERAFDRMPADSGPKNCTILLTIDTLRADALRAYDPAAAEHPNLDALLGESIVFSQARSAAPWTRPAFASMHTGLSVPAHGVEQIEAVLPPEVETLAERFATAGFATSALGDNTNVGAEFGFGQGFQRYDFFPHERIGDSLGAELSRRIGLHQLDGRTDLLTERAISQIEALRDESFFFWIHYLDPHMNYHPPAEYQPPGPAPARIGAEWKLGDDVRTGLFIPSADERRWIRALYDGELRWVDASIGRLLAAVRDAGLDQRCVIVLSSDHGEEFWDHGATQHGHALYDESIRVPLAIRLPGASERGVVPTPVSTEQIPASILELMRLPIPDGAAIAPSLVRLWRAPGTAGENPPAVSTGMLYFDAQVSVVYEHWKVIRNVASGQRTVFDLSADPKEQHPLLDTGAAIVAADDAERVWRERAAAARTVFRIPGRPSAELDEEALEQLRALGYVQ